MLNRLRHPNRATGGAANNDEKSDIRDLEKDAGKPLDTSPVRWMTFRVFMMGVIVSIGGMIFGYDTGMKTGLGFSA